MTFHPKYVSMMVPPVLAVALVLTARYAWRTGARGRALATAWPALFHGWFLMIALGAHCTEVLINLARGRSVVGDTPLAYGWRVYSLVLFGAVLMTLGARGARHARRLLAGDAAAVPELLRTHAAVLAVVVPLVPFERFFGPLVTAVTVLVAASVALRGERRSAAHAHPAARLLAVE
jgi:hypothetical protein